MHNSHDLIRIFNNCFAQRFSTRLIPGAAEPLYEPAVDNEHATIFFREDYFASALHEVAHWCIAGDARRKQIDYGYWYIADGRNEAQQKAFYKAEVKPQALEWCFSVACGFPFKISVDNVEASDIDWEQHANDTKAFKQSCMKQIEQWFAEADKLPERGKVFIDELTQFYRNGKTIELVDFRAAIV